MFGPVLLAWHQQHLDITILIYLFPAMSAEMSLDTKPWERSIKLSVCLWLPGCSIKCGKLSACHDDPPGPHSCSCGHWQRMPHFLAWRLILARRCSSTLPRSLLRRALAARREAMSPQLMALDSDISATSVTPLGADGS